MSWPDEIEYANGACGECQRCGEPTAEEWHAFCGPCFRIEQGYDDEPAPEWRTRRDEDRRGAAAVTAANDAFGACPGCGRHRLLFDRGGLRVCLDCRDERRRP